MKSLINGRKGSLSFSYNNTSTDERPSDLPAYYISTKFNKNLTEEYSTLISTTLEGLLYNNPYYTPSDFLITTGQAMS